MNFTVGPCMSCGQINCEGFSCQKHMLKGLRETVREIKDSQIFGDLLAKETNKQEELQKMDAEIKALEKEIEYQTKVRHLKMLHARLQELRGQ